MTGARVELRGMTWDHPRGYEPLVAASRQYAGAFGVEIVWDRRSLQAFADAPLTGLARSHDLVVLDHPHVGRIAVDGCLLPLPFPDPQDSAGVSIGGSLESYVRDGSLWAYPIDAACQMAVRRADYSGPVLTEWDRLAVGDPGSDIRMVTPLLPVDSCCLLMSLVASSGEVTLPRSEKEFVSARNGIRALEIIKSLYRAGPSEAVGWNPVRVLELLACSDEFDYSPCLFGYINYARDGFRPNRLIYVDVPVFRGMDISRTILGGAGIGVSAETAHPEAATAFARWLSSEPVQSGIYLESEGQPAHRQTWLKAASDPRYAGFLDGGRRTLETAWTRPCDPWFLGFIDDLCDIFPSFLIRDRSEEGFLAAINRIFRHHCGLRSQS